MAVLALVAGTPDTLVAGIQHGSRFRSGADLCSPKHAIHCHLHHRPRPSFCQHFSRHRQGHRQPLATGIAFDAFVTVDAFVAFVAIDTTTPKGTANSATVSHRLQPSASRQACAPAAQQLTLAAAQQLAALATATVIIDRQRRRPRPWTHAEPHKIINQDLLIIGERCVLLVGYRGGKVPTPLCPLTAARSSHRVGYEVVSDQTRLILTKR